MENVTCTVHCVCCSGEREVDIANCVSLYVKQLKLPSPSHQRRQQSLHHHHLRRQAVSHLQEVAHLPQMAGLLVCLELYMTQARTTMTQLRMHAGREVPSKPVLVAHPLHVLAQANPNDPLCLLTATVL